MMEQTKIFTALKGVRGRKPVEYAALEQLLVRFSQLVLEQRSIAEIDINPLLASPERLLALDARIVLHAPPWRSMICPSPPSVPIPCSMSRAGPCEMEIRSPSVPSAPKTSRSW
jgi:acetyltransferase